MAILIAIYIAYFYRDHSHNYYSCDTQHLRTVVRDILFTVSYEAVLLAECSIREGFCQSVLLNVQDVAESYSYMQYNLCIIWTHWNYL